MTSNNADAEANIRIDHSQRPVIQGCKHCRARSTNTSFCRELRREHACQVLLLDDWIRTGLITLYLHLPVEIPTPSPQLPQPAYLLPTS